ncbi:MAG: hypothetical protein JXC32_00910 [Anaerolineae bacterium]|nr:hypothetical protein [Anaerolineae bacterium]
MGTTNLTDRTTGFAIPLRPYRTAGILPALPPPPDNLATTTAPKAFSGAPKGLL